MQAPVEIHYAGVVVARAEQMREVEGGELFIATKEPLPVGTLVGVSTPEAQFNVRVAHVVETVDGADNGMRVRRLAADDPGASLWVPPPPAKPAPAPVAAPVAEEKAPEAEMPVARVPEAPATPEPAEAQAAVAEPATTQAPPQPEAAPAPAEAPVAAAAAEPVPEAAPADEVADNSAAASDETDTADRQAGQMPLIDDLPPARRTQGGTARRRTKRRK